MARSSMPLSPLFCLFLSTSRLHFSLVAALELALPVPQRLSQRQTFEGGWAIGLPGVTCPSDTPVLCTSSNIANPACCPSGTTCFGLSSLYCCPTSTDCATVVEEFPQCANSTWTLYQLGSSSSGYFCCPPGQFGVLPVQNYGGLCQLNGVELPASRIATPVGSQALTAGSGAAAPATTATTTGRTTRTITTLSTGTDGSVSKVTQISTGDATFTKTSAPGSTSASTGDNSGGTNSNSSSSKSLSAGTIAGIAIGGLAVLALFILAFLFYRYISSKNKRSEGGFLPQDQVPQYSAVPVRDSSPGMQSYPKSPAKSASGLHTGETPIAGNVSPLHGGYGPRPVEAPGPQPWEGRAEIGSSR